MRSKLPVVMAALAVCAAVLLPATAASAAWNDVMSQRTVLSQWCAVHGYPGSSGNWQDGLYCWKPVQGSVLQSQTPGYMCRSIIGDPTINFHILLPIERKDGACGYWVG